MQILTFRGKEASQSPSPHFFPLSAVLSVHTASATSSVFLRNPDANFFSLFSFLSSRSFSALTANYRSRLPLGFSFLMIFYPLATFSISLVLKHIHTLIHAAKTKSSLFFWRVGVFSTSSACCLGSVFKHDMSRSIEMCGGT